MGIQTPIYERPEGQRIWVVRASSGNFVEHFNKGNEVAVGHLDAINYSVETAPKSVDLDKAAAILNGVEGTSKAGTSSHINQVDNFINAMTVGHLVVTLDSAKLRVGRIISDPYFSKTPVKVTHGVGGEWSTEMNFHLRRKVSWGPEFKRTDIPTAMDMSLRAHQTVFSIDAYWESVYHLLYPVFSYQDCLYLSANIRQKHDIDNYSVARFLTILSEIEIISKTIAHQNKTDITFEELRQIFRNHEAFCLATKAEFMSPGTIWAKLKGLKKEDYAIAAFCFVVLFGGEGFGVKFDGIIDKEMRAQVLNIVLEKARKEEDEQIINKLDIRLPSYNTKPLQDKSKDNPALLA